MRTLHHHPLYASSRTFRLMLAERGLVFMPKLESPWERHDDFLAMNPAGTVPVLVTEDGIVLAGAMVIAEFMRLPPGHGRAAAAPAEQYEPCSHARHAVALPAG